MFDGDDGERNKKIVIGVLVTLCVGFLVWQVGKGMGYFGTSESTAGGPAVTTGTPATQLEPDGSIPKVVIEPPPEATPANRRRVSDPQ